MKPKNVKLAYTIHVDYGTDGWAWMKPSDDEAMHIGNWAGEYNGWYGDQAISTELFEDFNQWMLMYERAKLYIHENVIKFDWMAFEGKGLHLAKRLKLELGDSVTVRYLKPSEDPDYDLNKRLEVLSNGETIEINR